MSSSDSEDENIRKFLEAADTTFINDAMFQSQSSTTSQGRNKKDTAPLPSGSQKSNRYIVDEENVFQSDINVTESMKKFIGKKLSTLIEQQIAFVDVQTNLIKTKKSSRDSGVKLLGDCDHFLKISTQQENEETKNVKKTVRPIRKRNIETSNIDFGQKLMLAAVLPDYIIHESTKCWSNRPKSTLYEYKKEGKTLIQQTPETEFSKEKRKNNWNDSKIALFRKKSKKQ